MDFPHIRVTLVRTQADDVGRPDLICLDTSRVLDDVLHVPCGLIATRITSVISVSSV